MTELMREWFFIKSLIINKFCILSNRTPASSLNFTHHAFPHPTEQVFGMTQNIELHIISS